MKNKIIILLMVLLVLSIYPIWRYTSNAKILVDNLLDKSAPLGKWTHGSVSTSFSGEITVSNLFFNPEGYEQGFEIKSMKITVDPLFILKHSRIELGYLLPETVSLSLNSIRLNTKSDDLFSSFKTKNLWMPVAGFAGSFGCNKDSLNEFDPKDIDQIINPDQVFNLDLYYARLIDGTIDFDLIIDAEEMFSTTWSSNLQSSYQDKRIIPEELLVEELFYSYLDNGYNLKRNNICAQNYNDSFAAYRLNAAKQLQKFLRVNYTKELPKILTTWYQRSLNPEAEYNAVIEFPERKFLSNIFMMDQAQFFTNTEVKISLTPTEYEPVVLKPIDFTNIDQEQLMKEHLKIQQELKQQEVAKQQEIEDKNKPNIVKIGHKKSSYIAISNLGSYIDRRIRIKTQIGRPIKGILAAVHKDIIVLNTAYKTGSAELSLPINKILSVELIK
jgi:hypothetical protein